MHTRQVELDGARIHYRIGGSGTCVLLLHGFGEDGTIWEPLGNELTGCRLIIPDLPGCGKSGMSDDTSMEGVAATLHTLLQHEGIDRCIIIGHSMGGYIALAFLEAFPQAVAALGLFHSSTFADSEEKKATREKGIHFIETHGAAAFQESTAANLFAPQTKEQRPELLAQYIQTVKNADAGTLIAYYQAMMRRPDRTHLLSSNTIPFLFVIGKYDNAVPPADSLRQAHLPAVSQVHLLEQSGHMGMMEEPEQSRNLLQTFIATVPLF